MNQELVDEIEYTKELLANSGFFNREDIIEILEEQFIEEDIDFSNIGVAAIEKLFTDSGIIGGLVVSEGHITGRLVGVTIVGDLIDELENNGLYL